MFDPNRMQIMGKILSFESIITKNVNLTIIHILNMMKSYGGGGESQDFMKRLKFNIRKRMVKYILRGFTICVLIENKKYIFNEQSLVPTKKIDNLDVKRNPHKYFTIEFSYTMIIEIISNIDENY